MRPVRTNMLKHLRIFSPLMEVPISVSNEYKYFLNSNPKPNSKTLDVVNELTQAGIDHNTIWTTVSDSVTLISKRVVRLLWRIPFALTFILINVKRLKSLDIMSLQIVLGYVVYKRFFLDNYLIPIIISDISPSFQMQWSAAVSIGHDVLWWQDDYHHYKGFSIENYMPYKATIAVVLNQKGLETVRNKNPQANVYHRGQTKVKPMRSIPLKPRLGIAGNVLFNASELGIAYINELRLNLGAKNVKVRLHPNSKLAKNDFNMTWLELAEFDETLDQFAASVDVVVVGNSAIQLKLLCMGVPVVHVSWLDSLKFDIYGYCERRFSYGLDSSKNISIQKLSEFYADPGLPSRLAEYVNINQEEEILSLSKLKENLHSMMCKN